MEKLLICAKHIFIVKSLTLTIVTMKLVVGHTVSHFHKFHRQGSERTISGSSSSTHILSLKLIYTNIMITVCAKLFPCVSLRVPIEYVSLTRNLVGRHLPLSSSGSPPWYTGL